MYSGPRSSCLPKWSLMQSCVALAFLLSVTLLVFHSIVPSIGRRDYVSDDEGLLDGLPIPDFAPDLDIAARFNLLFPGSDESPLPAGSVAAGSAAGSAAESAGSHSRLVVIPDLHGDGQQALRALQLAGLVSVVPAVQPADVDAAGAAAAAAAGAGPEHTWRLPLPGGPAGAWPGGDWRWTGGDTVLVQLGDVVDRGPDSLALLVMLERLRHQARAAGGDVVMLLGNHELMNIQHDFRYVAYSEALALAEAGDLPPGWSRTAASTADGRRLAAGDGGAVAVAGPDASHGSHLPRSGIDSVQRELENAGKGNAAEDASLRAETMMGTNPGRHSAGERELLYGRKDGCGNCDFRAADAGGPIAEPTRGSVSQRKLLQQHRNHQQLLRGLELWRDALSADVPLGALIRHRRLAAIVDAGGCRILAVHAGAFPWMLRAVERLLLPPTTAAGGYDPPRKRPEAGVAAPGKTGTSDELQPDQYIAAWNAAVLAALRGCEGRRCRHGSVAAAAKFSTAADDYERFRRALADLLLGGEGAVWSRRYIHAAPQQVCDEVAVVAQRLGVQRLVVGHTVQRGGRVTRRCGGQLLMADVGLSQAIAGEMAVLQCTAGKLDVMYGNGRVERL